MMPPGVERNWDDNGWWMQELIKGYETGRQHEEMAIIKAQAGARI